MNRFRLLALSTLLATACGLDLVGTAALDGGLDAQAPDGMAPDGEAPDAVVGPDGEAPDSGGADVEVGDACGQSCPILTQLLVDAGPGFFPAAVLDPDAGCPTGYISSVGYEKPTTLPASACSCGACTADAGPCNDNGNLQLSHGDNNVCDQTGSTIDMNGGNCQNEMLSAGHKLSGTVPPTASNQGSCSVVTNKGDSSKVAATAHLICNAPPACVEQACNLPQGTKICLSSLGDVACPPGAPNKTKLGTSFDVACADCTCGSQTTCRGTLSLWSQGNCKGTKQDLTIGQCGASPADSSSYNVTLTATAACTNVMPGAPTGATLSGTVGTLCCPN